MARTRGLLLTMVHHGWAFCSRSMSCRGKFMGVLEAGLSDQGDDSSSSSSSAGGEDLEDTTDAGTSAKRPKKVLTVEDLERAGYQSGPSVLFMKPQQAEGQTDWNW